MYQAFIVATRPYPEKAANDQFHPDLDSARERQEKLNAQSEGKPWKVYEITIEVTKEIEFTNKACPGNDPAPENAKPSSTKEVDQTDECESCGNAYEIEWIKEGQDYNDFGYRYCPFCGEMFDIFIIPKKPKGPAL